MVELMYKRQIILFSNAIAFVIINLVEKIFQIVFKAETEKNIHLMSVLINIFYICNSMTI